MHKQSKADIVIIILFQLLFWGGLVVACFARELGFPNWLPRTILIIYGVVFGLYIVGSLLYGGVSLGLQWSKSLFDEHGSRSRILLLLPGYVVLAALGWLVFAVASRYVPDSGPLPLVALLLVPGAVVGLTIGLIKGSRK